MVSAILLAALIAVESRGNVNAIGDNGQAFGSLQIHQVVLDDVNSFAGTDYTREDCFDMETSETICEIYLSHYANEKRLGRPVSDEDRARIWNGGPNGYKHKATLGYWKRVSEALNNQ